MKYFSCFSWIGGFELWITQAYDNRPNILNMTEALWQDMSNSQEWTNRASCVGFSEIDKYATQIYQSHFPNHQPYGDITKIDTTTLPDFDCLVWGFPCQAFSIAGKRRGFEDTRGTLFFELARILRAKQPRLFVFENVKGLLSHDNGKTFSTIIATIDELGYDCQWQVLNSKNHGVPQNRERVFIVGHLRGTSRPKVFPFGYDCEKTDGVSWQCGNTLTARYYGGQANWNYIIESELHAQKDWLNIAIEYNASHDATKTNTWEVLPLLQKQDWATTIQQLKTDESPTLWQDEVLQSWLHEESVHRQNDDRRSEILSSTPQSQNDIHEVLSVWNMPPEKENWDTPQKWELEWQHTPKPTGDMPMMSHENAPNWEEKNSIFKKIERWEMKIRRLTPVEAERLQWFPDWWTEWVSDTQRYKCLGNAVTVNVIRDIFIKISKK